MRWVVTARRADRIEAVAGEIRPAGGRAMSLALDVAHAPAIGPELDPRAGGT
jgi:NADP-dependent 3-hydroxy acid dehydrogenase YdfG